MARFFGIAQGEEKTAPGLRVRVSEDGERVWMHGKWLDLGPDHAVIWIERKAEFRRSDGRSLRLGDFPAWVCRGTGKHPVIAAMFNVSQFEGGEIKLS
ncbi:MAG: hypothetical protein F8N39_07260 [Clostridiaceae bacterium]|nr:hypothetical protein [Clostridiaceae bacterium]